MISLDNLKKIETKTRLKSLVDNSYLKDINNENFKYIKEKFFKKESLEKVKLLNVGCGIFESVVEITSKYVGNPSLDMYFPTKEIITDYLTFGQGVFCLVRPTKDSDLKFSYLPGESYYRQDGIDYIFRNYEKINDSNILEQYYLITSYNGGIIENKLYKINQSKSSNIFNTNKYITFHNLLLTSDEVPLNSLEETEYLEEYIDTGLEKTLFVLRDSLLDQEKSVIEKIKSFVYSLDRKEVLFETQILRHGESFVIAKGINPPHDKRREKVLDETSRIELSGRMFFTENLDADIKYITNENPNLEYGRTQSGTQLEKISAITGIPLDFIGGLSRVGSIGEDSRELLHGNFLKTILNLREKIDKVLGEALLIILKDNPRINVSYIWSEITVKSDLKLVDELSIARQNKLVSQKTAIKKYLKLSDEEVEIELERMKEEENIVVNQ